MTETQLQKVIDDGKAKAEGLNAELKRLKLEADRDLKTTPSGSPAEILERRRARAQRIAAIPSEITHVEIGATQARIQLCELKEKALQPDVDKASVELQKAEAEAAEAEASLKAAKARFQEVRGRQGAYENSRFRAMGTLNDLKGRYGQELNHLSKGA